MREQAYIIINGMAYEMICEYGTFGADELSALGYMINAWLALFNLIPFRGFDGQRIIEWSKPAYFGILITAIG